MAVEIEYHNVTVTSDDAWCSCGHWRVSDHPAPHTAGFLHIIKERDKRRSQYLKERDNANTV